MPVHRVQDPLPKSNALERQATSPGVPPALQYCPAVITGLLFGMCERTSTAILAREGDCSQVTSEAAPKLKTSPERDDIGVSMLTPVMNERWVAWSPPPTARS